jgi:hypothetical protein
MYHAWERNAYTVLVGKSQEKRPPEDPVVDGKTILKMEL